MRLDRRIESTLQNLSLTIVPLTGGGAARRPICRA